MITLTQTKIHFSSRFKNINPTPSKTLLYGTICPICNNIVQASFLTESPVNLWNYEETAILHTKEGEHKGEFNYYFPTVESNLGDSCYESVFVKRPNGESYQTIQMKNHLINPDKIGKKPLEIFQVGERPCTHVITSSFKKDLAIKNYLGLITSSFSLDKLNLWNWQKSMDIILLDLSDQGIRPVVNKGLIPIYSIIGSRSKITYGLSLPNQTSYNK